MGHKQVQPQPGRQLVEFINTEDGLRIEFFRHKLKKRHGRNSSDERFEYKVWRCNRPVDCRSGYNSRIGWHELLREAAGFFSLNLAKEAFSKWQIKMVRSEPGWPLEIYPGDNAFLSVRVPAGLELK